MNINDVGPTQVKGDRLKAIFDRQYELTVKYKEIEKMPDFPMDANLLESQLWFKEFAWRTTEEIGEAIACLMEPEGQDGEVNWEHYNEELADALHFFIELCIIAGLDPTELIFEKTLIEIPLKEDLLEMGFVLAEQALTGKVLENPTLVNYLSLTGIVNTRLSQAMNCLKNKRWKQSQILTDIEKFHLYLRETFLAFLMLCFWSELDADKLTDLYFRKSEVNKFRQRSNY